MKKKLEIHSENILPIIKKWLYSDKEIFARELISNACDAIHKIKILRDKGECDVSDEDLRIDIVIDKENKTITFSDTGIGMDEGEVEKYIAQIAFSGAEEFMKKYESNNEKEQIIGHFGLGFYSSYMVAKEVQIETLSYKQGAKPANWRCDGSSEYSLQPGKKETRGTDITLYLSEGNEEFLEEAALKKVMDSYCTFLPCPIYLNGNRINHQEPLWIKNPSECSDKDYINFYKFLYPMDEEPLFWMHLNVDYPFNLKGILYFPKIKRDYDLNKSHVSLYCNRVFVSDNCKDLIPNYLTVLRGVIDSPDIPLNVSRSYLQMDRTVRQLSSHISKKVVDSLHALFRSDKERFLNCWEDVSFIVKLGALEDEKFYERVKDLLIWKNLDSEWTTAEEYLERSQGQTLYYTKEEGARSHLLDLYKKQGIEVLVAPTPLDNHLLHHLESKLTPAKFQRVDAAAIDALVDKEREKNILDSEGRTEAFKLAEFVRKKLGSETIEVEAKSLAADTLPGMVVFNEGERRMRDFIRSYDPSGSFNAPGKATFVVNTNNPLMNAAHKLDESDPDLAKELVTHLYDMALLSQKEMDGEALHAFINRGAEVLEKLAGKAIGQTK